MTQQPKSKLMAALEEIKMTFQEQIKTELHEMVLCKLISHRRFLQAAAIVDSHHETFNEDSGMSVTDAASLALELRR